MRGRSPEEPRLMGVLPKAAVDDLLSSRCKPYAVDRNGV
jgi:hypothetical protein